MKKTNKKISKFLKISLILCMIFSQLASPIKTLADELVPSYELKMELDTVNSSFVLTSVGAELVDGDNYILEINRSFEYADGKTNESENVTSYALVSEDELTAGYNILRDTFSYNGVSYVYANVYEIIDKTIDFTGYGNDDYQTLLEDTEKVTNIMDTSFEDVVSYNDTSLTMEVVGDGVLCDATDVNKCSVTNNVVEIKYTTENGNLNPNEKYHTVLMVNGVTSDLITEDLSVTSGSVSLDFSKMLPGVYTIEYEVRDKSNVEVISNYVEITYTNEGVTDRVDFIKNSEVNDELFYSYTILNDTEKEELGSSYSYLDNPLAVIFDSVVSEKISDIHTSYNLLEEDNRYHVVSSEYFYGAFNENSDSYKVSDVKSKLSNLLPYTTVSVVDANGSVVSNNEFIQNGMKLVVTILGEKVEYDFLVFSDVDGGYVETSDLSKLIDKVLNGDLSYYDSLNLDMDGNEKIDIIDISLLGFNIYTHEYNLPVTLVEGEITTVIGNSDEELRVGDSFEVLVSFDGFVDDDTVESYINAIEGYVNYDTDALKLESVECLDELFVGNYVNNRFIYASDETFAENDETFIVLTFVALTEGTHKVSVSDVSLVADGYVLTSNDSNELELTVERALHTDASIKSLHSNVGRFNKKFDSNDLEYTLYVDSSVNKVTLNGELNDSYAKTDGFKTYSLTGDTTYINLNVTAENGSVSVYKVKVVKVYKSSNNNLSELKIEGYDIEFNKNTLEYEITVGSDVDSLDITALVEDSNAWVKIEGNDNFKEGKNEVRITVYAENGSSRTYKLLVNKKANESVIVDEEDKDSNINTEKVVIIILIILVVVGLLYLIFKKDDEDDIRIEQVKPRNINDLKKSDLDSDKNDLKKENSEDKHKKNNNKKKK